MINMTYLINFMFLSLVLVSMVDSQTANASTALPETLLEFSQRCLSTSNSYSAGTAVTKLVIENRLTALSEAEIIQFELNEAAKRIGAHSASELVRSIPFELRSFIPENTGEFCSDTVDKLNTLNGSAITGVHYQLDRTNQFGVIFLIKGEVLGYATPSFYLF